MSGLRWCFRDFPYRVQRNHLSGDRRIYHRRFCDGSGRYHDCDTCASRYYDGGDPASFVPGKLKTPIVLEDEQRRAEGYLSSSDLKYLLGKQGTAVTDLRPSGIGKFDGVNFDVMSEGNYISKGTEIEIIKVEGSKLVVKQRGGEEYE